MGTVYLIRHGRTEANEKKLYCGSTDLPLSKAGTEELKNVSYQVPETSIFFISGMKRTEQTLKLLFGEVPYRIDSRFREVDFGIFEMKSYEELKEQEDYLQWITGENEKNVPPKGESGVQMKARVMEAFSELSSFREPVVLVTHGGVIASIMEELFPLEGKNRYQWQPKPGYGYVVKDGTYEELERNENII